MYVFQLLTCVIFVNAMRPKMSITISAYCVLLRIDIDHQDLGNFSFFSFMKLELGHEIIFVESVIKIYGIYYSLLTFADWSELV